MKGYRHIILIICLSLITATNQAALGGDTSKPIVLKSLIQSPPAAKLSKCFDAYLDDVEKATGGRIKFERYYSGMLAKAPAILEATGSGIVDISVFVPNYTPARAPLALVGYLPGAYKHAWVGAMAYMELYKTFPQMNKELAKNNIKVVSVWGTGPYYCLTRKPVKSLDDFKGFKISATGQVGLVVKALGGIPVGMPITEAYTALERNTIDGVFYGPSAITAYSMQEAAKYMWKVEVGGGVGPMGVNLDKWKSLPTDIQKIMLASGVNHAKNVEQIYQIDGDHVSMEKIKKAGVQITEPSKETAAEVRKVVRELVWKKWASDMDAKGLPGNKLMDLYVEYLNKFEPLCPFK